MNNFHPPYHAWILPENIKLPTKGTKLPHLKLTFARAEHLSELFLGSAYDSRHRLGKEESNQSLPGKRLGRQMQGLLSTELQATGPGRWRREMGRLRLI